MLLRKVIPPYHLPIVEEHDLTNVSSPSRFDHFKPSRSEHTTYDLSMSALGCAMIIDLVNNLPRSLCDSGRQNRRPNVDAFAFIVIDEVCTNLGDS